MGDNNKKKQEQNNELQTKEKLTLWNKTSSNHGLGSGFTTERSWVRISTEETFSYTTLIRTKSMKQLDYGTDFKFKI